MTGIVVLVVGGVLLILLIFFLIYASRVVKVGPNEALLVSGSSSGVRIIKGGRSFVWPIFEKADILSLELMTIEFKTPEVYTAKAIPIILDGVAQIKVKGDVESITTAGEQFLTKTRNEIERVALETLSGHIRAIIGELTVEEIYTKRENFAQKVQEVSAPDFANMGLEVVSLTIREIHDNQGYMEALGKPRAAEVKRDADVAMALRQRESIIETAKAQQQAQEEKFKAETLIAQSQRDFEMKKAEYQAQINQKKADADLAYDLEKYKVAQQVKAEEVRVISVEKERMIEVQERETLRMQNELMATIEKPAEAERRRIQTIADAERYRIEAEAEARAMATRNVGFADADATKAKGLADAEVVRANGMARAEIVKAQGTAEAEAMMKKADAWRAYNEAALAQMFIDKLPELARAVSEPLSKVEKIVMISNGSDGIGASKITKDVLDIVAQLPPVLESVAGLSLKDLVAKIPKLKADGGGGGGGGGGSHKKGG
jgi:flotillin